MSHIVEAAGGIPFRLRPAFQGWMKFSDHGALPPGTQPIASLDNIEVCLIHRQRYDDWSWPKGKLEVNESHRHAAIREMGEETGCILALGPRLGEVEYPLDQEGRKGNTDKQYTTHSKHVVYWMAAVLGQEEVVLSSDALGPVLRAREDEIDQVLWMRVPDARRKLSHSLDRDMLDIFVDQIELGAAQSHSLLIVRHGKAEGRKGWNGQEAQRPLTPKGASRSYALSRELACYCPTTLISSPWVRCMETLGTYSWRSGLPIIEADELTEDAYADDAELPYQFIRHQIQRMVSQGGRTAICMHRPVIGGIFKQLRPICISKTLASTLVSTSPYMPTGNALALFITIDDTGPHIIDIQKVAPIVY